jgi:methionyl-tRNA synthetase
MYISNMTHFLDEQGNIPKQMPKEAREHANFMALVVDNTTKNYPQTLTSTNTRCFEKGCHGMIKTALMVKSSEIHWYCPDCENEGVISEWQKTKWDNG